jgi:hypothetical protein
MPGRVKQMSIKWTKWTEKTIRKQHGAINLYRALYDGDHAQLSERAKQLIDKGEIVDQIIKGRTVASQVKTPYLVANVCKPIVDVPAMLVSLAMGQVTTSTNEEDFAGIESAVDDDGNPIDPLDNQKEMIEGIARRSNLQLEHKTNITHHQMDGGIVGVPFDGENGIRMEFKSRDVYWPHDDGMGCDLVYELAIEDDETEEETEYLHVYRERVENETLMTDHMLFTRDKSGRLAQIEDETEVMDILGLDELHREFIGRDKPFVVYWPNNKTFTHPLGRSALHNLENKQEEINWTLTRNAIVYERNGKPRIAVSKEVFQALSDKAYERYGDEGKIDHRDLEITTFDENGKAMEIIQIDVTKIGDLQYVKDIMKMMLMETSTSQKALDIFNEQGGAQSGVAKLYDLFISIMKAQQIMNEYVHFLQTLFENCLWIANQDDESIVIEEPRFQIKEMIQLSRKELIDQESTAFKNGTQSLKTTVENQNPNASDEWVDDEIAQIEEGQASTDSTSILAGRQTLNSLLDNRNPNGTPQTGQTGQNATGQTGQTGVTA